MHREDWSPASGLHGALDGGSSSVANHANVVSVVCERPARHEDDALAGHRGVSDKGGKDTCSCVELLGSLKGIVNDFVASGLCEGSDKDDAISVGLLQRCCWIHLAENIVMLLNTTCMKKGR